jgi:hypothetical protein
LLETHEHHLDRLVSQADAEHDKLFRPDGTKKFSDVEHVQREAELLEPVKAAAAEALDVEQAVKAALTDLESAAAYDVPLERLQAGDMSSFLDQSFYLNYQFTQGEAFNMRQNFIREDCADLPLAELARAVVAADLRGNRVERALYQRYASRRLEAAKASNPQGDPPRGYGELVEAVRRVAPVRTDVGKDVEALRNRSSGLRMEAAKANALGEPPQPHPAFTF